VVGLSGRWRGRRRGRLRVRREDSSVLVGGRPTCFFFPPSPTRTGELTGCFPLPRLSPLQQLHVSLVRRPATRLEYYGLYARATWEGRLPACRGSRQTLA
jgi:hypothetical protein